MGWTDDLVWFDGENEEEILSRFVQYCAQYPNFGNIEIALHCFKDLRDSASRGTQAALVWGRDIGIQERIRLAKLNGGREARTPTKEEAQAEVYKLAQDEEMDPRQKKAKLDSYKLLFESMGWITKPNDGGKEEGRRVLPTFVIAKYDD